MADYGGDQHKCKRVHDWKRKQRQSMSEGIKKTMMPSGDLPNNSNVWQTSDPVRLAKEGPRN